MVQLDGAAVRALVGKLPPHMFDELCDALPELFDGLTEEQVNKYVHWHECNDDYTLDDVARDYGYVDYIDMEDDESYILWHDDDGILVID